MWKEVDIKVGDNEYHVSVDGNTYWDPEESRFVTDIHSYNIVDMDDIDVTQHLKNSVVVEILDRIYSIDFSVEIENNCE